MCQSESLDQDFFERNTRLDVISSSEKEDSMKKLFEINPENLFVVRDAMLRSRAVILVIGTCTRIVVLVLVASAKSAVI